MRKKNDDEIIELKNRVFTNKKGYEAKIIEYHNSNDIDIEFENGIIKRHQQLSSLEKGNFTFDIFSLRKKELEDLKKQKIIKQKYDPRRYSDKDGVYQTANGKWCGFVTINDDHIYLGTTDDKDGLIKLRNDYLNLYYYQENNIDEIWKIITEFENYSVSNFGRIKNNTSGYILQGGFDKNGYRQVTLSNNGKQFNRRICRLVAIAFIPNPNNLPQVNHKDEIVTHDNVDNLEWCTALYNNNYGNHPNSRKKYIKCIETGEVFLGVREAANKFNCTKARIKYACLHSHITINNMHLKYLNDGEENEL